MLEYYCLEPVRVEPGKRGFVTAAVLPCGLCGRVIDNSGGPGPAICKPCGDAFNRQQLMGCVKWDDAPAPESAQQDAGEGDKQ